MTSTKTALILDSIDRGTITTTLQTNGYFRKLKLLNSGENNWDSICDILESDTENDIIVLGKFTEHNLFRMCLPSYKDVVEKLIGLLKSKKHLIFIYKDNLNGNFSYFKSVEIKETAYEVDEQEDYLKYRHNEIKSWILYNGLKDTEEEYFSRVIELLKKLKKEINVLPYEKLVDVEIAGQSFIENIAEGLMFRIYVPNDRIWSSEFDRFITLFKDYAANVAKVELKISQNRTDLGVVCSLYSVRNNIAETDITTLYKEFTSFMDLCSVNPAEAEKLLTELGLSEVKTQTILRKYIKEAQRLTLDIKQERELKILSIKHRLQNELQELELSKDIEDYIENIVPSSHSTKHLTFGQPNIQHQTVLINPQFINKVEGIVVSELNGHINFTPEEIEFEKLIKKYSLTLSESSELQTSLFELKDGASSKEKKRGAWQKLYGFLSKVGDKIGDVGVALLTKYLEQKMGL